MLPGGPAGLEMGVTLHRAHRSIRPKHAVRRLKDTIEKHADGDKSRRGPRSTNCSYGYLSHPQEKGGLRKQAAQFVCREE
jgi:hypothetical protein